MLIRGAPRWIATACGLAMTSECVGLAMTSECVGFAMTSECAGFAMTSECVGLGMTSECAGLGMTSECACLGMTAKLHAGHEAGFVIASAARQSMLLRGAPRWIATAYGLALTKGSKGMRRLQRCRQHLTVVLLGSQTRIGLVAVVGHGARDDGVKRFDLDPHRGQALG